VHHRLGLRGQLWSSSTPATQRFRAVVRRIPRKRARGDSLRAIADSLNRHKVPTAQGGAKRYTVAVRGVRSLQLIPTALRAGISRSGREI
jgi:hypothetical protein